MNQSALSGASLGGGAGTSVSKVAPKKRKPVVIRATAPDGQVYRMTWQGAGEPTDADIESAFQNMRSAHEKAQASFGGADSDGSVATRVHPTIEAMRRNGASPEAIAEQERRLALEPKLMERSGKFRPPTVEKVQRGVAGMTDSLTNTLADPRIQAVERALLPGNAKFGKKGATGHAAGVAASAIVNPVDLAADAYIMSGLTSDATPVQRALSGLNIILKGTPAVPMAAGAAVKGGAKLAKAAAKKAIPTIAEDAINAGARAMGPDSVRGPAQFDLPAPRANAPDMPTNPQNVGTSPVGEAVGATLPTSPGTTSKGVESLLTNAERQAIYQQRDNPEALKSLIEYYTPHANDPKAAEIIRIANETMQGDAFKAARGQGDNLESKMSLSMLDQAMRKLGMPDDQVKGTLAALNPILEQNPGAIFKVVDQIDPSGKLKQEFAAPFYSKLEQVAREKLPNRATPDQIRKTLIAAGVKPEEMQWTRMDDILSGDTVTKQDILDHLQENQVRVEEVMKGTGAARAGETVEQSQIRIQDEAIALARRYSIPYEEAYQEVIKKAGGRTKFGQYTLPGGEDYRELLLTLPVRTKGQLPDMVTWLRRRFGGSVARLSDEELESAKAIYERQVVDGQMDAYQIEDASNNFRGSHWDEPNVLAHIRFDTRKGPNGEKILHVAEIQSDWHQKGRKSGYIDSQKPYEVFDPADGKPVARYATEAEARAHAERAGLDYSDAATIKADGQVPDAPFKKNWHELAMKRVMRYAAENDFDRVSWDTGITNAERYDLSKQVRQVDYDPSTQTLQAWDKNGPHSVFNEVVPPEKIADYIGKDAAQKLLSTQPDNGLHTLRGQDLKVGGEGMKGFYDKILPDTANKMGKRFGAKVEPGTITDERIRAVSPNGEATMPAHSIAITPEMKASLLNEGQPLFQKGKEGIKGAYSPSSRVIELVQGKADVSTVIHEVAHDWHGFLKDHPEHGPIIRKHYGDMTDEAGAEAFARHFERFLATGKSPVSGLQRVFEAVRDWMKQIYTKWTHGNAPAEVEAIFNRTYKNPSERTLQLVREYEDIVGTRAKSADPLAPDASTAERGPGDFYTEGGSGTTPPPTPPTATAGVPEPPKPKTALDFAKEASYVARGLKLGADVGALLRQGAEMAANDPIQWVKSVGTGLSKTDKAKLAKHYQMLEERSINGNKMADVRKSAGLKISSADAEEAFASKLFDKVPVLNKLENFQKAFLDSGRIERFDSFYRKFPDATEKELKQYAAYLNSAMGKSNVSRVPELLEVVMTAPRWTSSRWEMAGRLMASPVTVTKALRGNKAAMQEAKNLGRYAMAMYGALKVAESQGATVEFDPRSSDFLKMRVGEKLFDPTSGVAAPIRTSLRMMLFARGEGSFNANAATELGKVLTNTANPVITTPWGLITQKSLSGFDLDPEERGALVMLPLIANGAMQAWNKDGPASAMIQTGTELVGINSSRYPKSVPKWNKRKGEGTKAQQVLDKIPF